MSLFGSRKDNYENFKIFLGKQNQASEIAARSQALFSAGPPPPPPPPTPPPTTTPTTPGQHRQALMLVHMLTTFAACQHYSCIYSCRWQRLKAGRWTPRSLLLVISLWQTTNVYMAWPALCLIHTTAEYCSMSYSLGRHTDFLQTTCWAKTAYLSRYQLNSWLWGPIALGTHTNLTKT